MNVPHQVTNREWPKVALDHVATIERFAIQPEAISKGTAYLGLEHIASGGTILGAKPVDEGELASSKFRFDERHVLYGKLRPYLAKIACPKFSGICSTDILPILPGPDLDRRFLCYFLRQPSMVNYANSRAAGANLPRLSPSALAEFEIPLPPLTEQRRIATALDRADALRVKRRAALGQIDSLTQSLFLQLFGDQSDRQRTTMSLGEAVEMVTVGHVGPTSEFFCDNGIPFLRTGNVGTLEIIRSDLKRVTLEFHRRLKKSTLKEGDVLVSRVISDEVRCALVPPEFDGANCANVIVIRPGKRMVGEYLAQLIYLPRSQAAFLQRRVGSAQSVVNTRVLQDWQIQVPSIGAQRKFARRVRAVEKLKTAQRASLAEIDALFATLQHRAFRGEL